MSWWPFTSTTDDTFKDLDPSLREFLDNEKLAHSSTTSSSTQTRRRRRRNPNDPNTYRDDLAIPPPKGPPPAPGARIHHRETEEATNAPTGHSSEIPKPVPPESLFSDGRYAHLWKDYQPYRTIEQASKSDAEKLSDILHAYTARKHEMKSAALENCAQAQIDLHNCFRNGKWKTRMTMCGEENRGLQRCVDVQGKLLRALGFMSMWERSDEEAERIQMHADRLYQRMLRQEREAEEARAKGLPVPPVGELIRERRPDEAGVAAEAPLEPGEVRPFTDTLTWENMPQARKDLYLKEKWKDLSAMEVEIAKKDFNQQVLLARTMSWRMREHELDDYKNRMQRTEAGKKTFGDWIKEWFDMRSYPELPANKTEGQNATENQQ